MGHGSSRTVTARHMPELNGHSSEPAKLLESPYTNHSQRFSATVRCFYNNAGRLLTAGVDCLGTTVGEASHDRCMRVSDRPSQGLSDAKSA